MKTVQVSAVFLFLALTVSAPAAAQSGLSDPCSAYPMPLTLAASNTSSQMLELRIACLNAELAKLSQVDARVPVAQNKSNGRNQSHIYLGQLGGNPYLPDSTSNPYGSIGNRFAPNSLSNPFGQYGNRFSPNSPLNPYSVNAERTGRRHAEVRGTACHNAAKHRFGVHALQHEDRVTHGFETARVESHGPEILLQPIQQMSRGSVSGIAATTNENTLFPGVQSERGNLRTVVRIGEDGEEHSLSAGEDLWPVMKNFPSVRIWRGQSFRHAPRGRDSPQALARGVSKNDGAVGSPARPSQVAWKRADGRYGAATHRDALEQIGRSAPIIESHPLAVRGEERRIELPPPDTRVSDRS